MREFEYIDWIRSHTPVSGPAEVLVGPGDDCAVVKMDGKIAITTDQCVDGVHFDISRCGAEAAAAKTFKRSLSDIAAMGAVPLAAVATVAIVASDDSEKIAQGLHNGLRAESEKWQCPVIGGDVSIIPSGRLHMTVTMWGRCDYTPILRSGAKAGDLILVTGSLGRAWQSGRDLSFTPRIAEALILAEKYRPTAMMDISDGIAGDIGHICRESGLGCEIYADKLPTSAAAQNCEDPVRATLCDGEDYELLFTASEDISHKILADKPFQTPVSIVGKMLEGKHISLIHNGTSTDMSSFASGFEHKS